MRLHRAASFGGAFLPLERQRTSGSRAGVRDARGSTYVRPIVYRGRESPASPEAHPGYFILYVPVAWLQKVVTSGWISFGGTTSLATPVVTMPSYIPVPANSSRTSLPSASYR